MVLEMLVMARDRGLELNGSRSRFPARQGGE